NSGAGPCWNNVPAKGSGRNENFSQAKILIGGHGRRCTRDIKSPPVDENRIYSIGFAVNFE
ncbi:hypothetical protein CLOSCI_02978, partial [[Clostridium] scindens ATCC 35704]|uniref:hypothetical protein n=1 Tax=Clostridium scindens (strain JCM 10418 / VPI 12708) TaxID=29347 RepID=UPI0001657BAF